MLGAVAAGGDGKLELGGCEIEDQIRIPILTHGEGEGVTRAGHFVDVHGNGHAVHIVKEPLGELQVAVVSADGGVAVQVENLAVVRVVHILAAHQLGVVAACAILGDAGLQRLVEVILQDGLGRLGFAFYLQRHFYAGAALYKLLIRHVENRHAFGVEEHGLYIGIAAGVVQGIAAVVLMENRGTGMVDDDRISRLIDGEGVVTGAAELIVEVAAGHDGIGRLRPGSGVEQIRRSVRRQKADAVLRAGTGGGEGHVDLAVMQQNRGAFVDGEALHLPGIFRHGDDHAVAGKLGGIAGINAGNVNAGDAIGVGCVAGKVRPGVVGFVPHLKIGHIQGHGVKAGGVAGL